MKLSLTIIILCLMFSIAIASDNAINSADEAVAKALEYTGFDKCKSYVKKPAEQIAHLITAIDTTTPFLHENINGRSAWQVELKDVSLHLKGNTPEGIILGPIDFKILIDSLTGIPLRINSVSTIPLDLEPVRAVAAAQLTSLGEKYLGLPEQYPLITIAEVLDQCKFYPALAKEIIISYVLYSKNDSPPQPAWIIYLRGLPPISSSYPRPDLDYTTTNSRYVFSANELVLLEHNNLPYRLKSNDK